MVLFQLKYARMEKYVWTRRQLIRFIDIGEIWQKYHDMGVYNKVIFEKYIQPKYGIGIGTFYKALNVPAKRLLAMMGDKDVLRTDEKYNILQ
jgi:hypothetical protein